MLAHLSWQALTILSVTLHSFGSTLGKYQVHKGSAFQVLAYKYLIASLIVSTVWLFTVGTLPDTWWLIYLYGIAVGTTVAFYTAAIRHSLSKSVLTLPIKRFLGITWSSIFLSEFLLFDVTKNTGRLMLLGLFLMLLASWLFYEKSDGVRRWNKLIWINIFLGSLVPVAAKILLEIAEPVTVLMLQYFGSLTASVGFCIIRSHRFYLGKRFAVIGFTHGVTNSVASLMWFTALSMVTVTEIVLLRTPLYMILTTLAGLYVYRERKSLTPRKIAGMIVALLLMIVVLLVSS